MFRGIERKSFYTMERIWFSTKEGSNADIIRYNRTAIPMSGKFVHCEGVETVLTDLKKSTGEILSVSHKTIRYEVNKCEKEQVAITFYTAEDLKKESGIVDEFEQAYIGFAKALGLREVVKAYKRSKIDNYIESNCILLSKARKDDVVIYHLYSYGGSESVLNYSVSNYRANTENKNLAGRMNKLLHIKDMDWLRTKGVTLYDWGNISSSVNPNGIDKFKMSFGGEVVTVYNSFVGNTVLGKVLVMLYKMTHRK